jgi:hypothetical protein
VAAFRLGHSMVRPTYNWNRIFSGSGGLLEYMFEFSGLGGNLGGDIRLITSWVADFRRMYDFAAGGHPELKPASNVNQARRIDTRLTVPLGNLPPSTFGGPGSTWTISPRPRRTPSPPTRRSGSTSFAKPS